MNSVLRLVATTGLAGFLFAAPVLSQGEFLDLARAPSATGSYLAGQEAMSELRTADAARFFADAAGDEWNNPLVIHNAFIAFAANGEIERSADSARRMLELEPANQLAQLVIATEALKNRRYAAAIRDLDKLGSDSFEGITGTILRAWSLIGDGRYDEAMTSLDKIGESGLEEFLVFHRAIMAEVAGDSAAAQDYISRAIETDPYTADIVIAYGRILGGAGRFEDALDAIVAFEAQGLSHPVVTQLKQQLRSRAGKIVYSWTIAPPARSLPAGASASFNSAEVNVPPGGDELTISLGEPQV